MGMNTLRILIVLAIAIYPAVTNAEPIAPNRITVLDGDTIRIDNQKPDHRLVGFNAPETTRAKTAHERRVGEFARDRLKEIVAAGNLDYSKVPCACQPGTEGTHKCNFGRFCGVLTANGIDVGKTLIEEELAVPFVCGATRCPKMNNPWRRESRADE